MQARAAASNTLYVVPAGHADLARMLAPRGQVVVVSLDEAIEAAQRAASQRDFSSICLIGAPWQLPMFQASDPTDKDDAVPTDNVYGLPTTPDEDELRGGEGLVPRVPVGRIPTVDVALVGKILAQGDGLVPHWRGGLAVTAQVWQGASRAVLEAIAGANGPTLHASPPVLEAHVAEAMSNPPGRVYFNVHGSGQEAVWVGQRGNEYPAVLRPGHVRVAPSAIAVSEACYGASLNEGEEAIGTSFLQRGAGVFVGSTIIAWGPPVAPPGLADLIVIGFYQGLDAGLTAGQALQQAKRRLLKAATVDGAPPSPQAHNTLLSFVLYGSPEARVAGVEPTTPPPLPALTRPTRASARSKGEGGGSTLAALRAGMADRSSSALGSVRDRMSAGLDERDWQELSRGRLAFADLARTFAHGAELQRRLASLLGGAPGSVDVLRYRGKTVGRVSITATTSTPWGKQHVAIITDEEGTPLEEIVSR